MKKEVIDNMLDYLAELWEHDTDDEWENHWINVIGMTEDDMREYSLIRE